MLPYSCHRIFVAVLLYGSFLLGLCNSSVKATETPRWKYELTPPPITLMYPSAEQGAIMTPPPAPEGAADPRSIPAVLKNDPNLPTPSNSLGGDSTIGSGETAGSGTTGTTNPNTGSSDDLSRLKALEDKMQAMLLAGSGGGSGMLSSTDTPHGGQGGGFGNTTGLGSAGIGAGFGVGGNETSPIWASVAIFIAVAAIGALVFAIFTAMDFRRRWLDSLTSQNQHLRVDFDVQMEEWTRPQVAFSSSSDFTGFFPKYGR